MRALPVFASAALLAACTTEAPQSAGSLAPPRAGAAATGLDRVIGQDARALTALFGPSALDLREGPARKLQYRGPACVLDAYLYPPSSGGEPRVTWIDARGPKGDDLDRASCIAALARTPSAVKRR